MGRADVPRRSRQDERDRLALRLVGVRARIEQLEQRRAALTEIGSASRLSQDARIGRAAACAATSASAAETAWARALESLEKSAQAHEAAAECHERCVAHRSGDVGAHARRADEHHRDAEADWLRAAEMRRSGMGHAPEVR